MKQIPKTPLENPVDRFLFSCLIIGEVILTWVDTHQSDGEKSPTPLRRIRGAGRAARFPELEARRRGWQPLGRQQKNQPKKGEDIAAVMSLPSGICHIPFFVKETGHLQALSKASPVDLEKPLIRDLTYLTN